MFSDPENHRQDQQKGEKDQGPLFTTRQQIELPVETFGHLRVHVTTGHKSPDGRKQCDNLAVDTQGKKKCYGNRCDKFHKEYEEPLVFDLEQATT